MYRSTVLNVIKLGCYKIKLECYNFKMLNVNPTITTKKSAIEYRQKEMRRKSKISPPKTKRKQKDSNAGRKKGKKAIRHIKNKCQIVRNNSLLSIILNAIN